MRGRYMFSWEMNRKKVTVQRRKKRKKVVKGGNGEGDRRQMSKWENNVQEEERKRFEKKKQYGKGIKVERKWKLVKMEKKSRVEVLKIELKRERGKNKGRKGGIWDDNKS